MSIITSFISVYFFCNSACLLFWFSELSLDMELDPGALRLSLLKKEFELDDWLVNLNIKLKVYRKVDKVSPDKFDSSFYACCFCMLCSNVLNACFYRFLAFNNKFHG